MNKERIAQWVEFSLAVTKLIGSLVVSGIFVAFGGYVVKYLWNGIIPPTFGLKPLTWAQATGVDTLVSFVVASRRSTTDKTMLEVVVHVVTLNLLYMLIGWVVMKFI